MFRLTAFLVLTVTCHSNFVYGDPWLMLGEFYTDDVIAALGMKVYTEKSYMAVSTRMQATFHTQEDKQITCVIAAAIHMKGDVTVVDGGINSQNVTLRYVTNNGEPDIFFVLIQSSNVNSGIIRVNAVSNSRYTIVFDSFRQWKTDRAET